MCDNFANFGMSTYKVQHKYYYNKILRTTILYYIKIVI